MMDKHPTLSCACGCGKTWRELREDFPLTFEITTSPNPWALPKGKRFIGRLVPEPASDEHTGGFGFVGHWEAFFHGKWYSGNLEDEYARLAPAQPPEEKCDATPDA